ncbi:hypothetical protein BpHYR1_003635 [Brachionus plicatilis]|uniref:Uncharacterized protein n=1 Tax=Brachionus plicatilis TaxID=10195 RepID=A0A3M7PD31_BRAPC|nr:hypothetical protein BpHYR1_003635 [Brachionus plicatilis]
MFNWCCHSICNLLNITAYCQTSQVFFETYQYLSYLKSSLFSNLQHIRISKPGVPSLIPVTSGYTEFEGTRKKNKISKTFKQRLLLQVYFIESTFNTANIT